MLDHAKQYFYNKEHMLTITSILLGFVKHEQKRPLDLGNVESLICSIMKVLEVHGSDGRCLSHFHQNAHNLCVILKN